jgi:hypothetical protein
MALVSSVELSSIEIPEVPEIPGDDDEPVESVTSLSDADPTKCYSISTTTRGAWAVDDAGTHFSTTGVEGYEVDAEDARQQFAILSANGEDYYLYSVSAKKFVKRDRTLVAGAADAIEFVDASSIGEGRVLVRFRDLANSNINIGGDNQMVINSWGIIDAGNAVLIAEAGNFDAAEALSKDNATEAITMEIADNGEYLAVVDGIAAKYLDSGVYVSFCYSDGTTDYCSGVIGYSIGAYCKNQAATSGAMADLAAATAVYGYYAKQMFA